MKLHGFLSEGKHESCMLIPMFNLFTEEDDEQLAAAVVEGVDRDYESDNSECDSIATYSSGKIFSRLVTLGGKFRVQTFPRNFQISRELKARYHEIPQVSFFMNIPKAYFFP